VAELEQACCAPEAQASCCEAGEKAGCCDPQHSPGCGCGAGRREASIPTDVQDAVRERYATAAIAVREAETGEASCGCGPAVTDQETLEIFGANLYEDDDRAALPDEARMASLGCGNPTAVAELHEGETVLDLGSGGGIDVLLSARRVGVTGKAYGVDMTDEMLELARANQRQAKVENVEFLKGTIERIPLPANSVDVIISNCVINLSGDKPRVLAEAARVLRPGGRFAVSDVIADEDMDEATRNDMQLWTGCIAGALTKAEFQAALAAAGFEQVDVRETHRVHEHAGSAIVRARKPLVSLATSKSGPGSTADR
jgi:arsenite methyltransferase